MVVHSVGPGPVERKQGFGRYLSTLAAILPYPARAQHGSGQIASTWNASPKERRREPRQAARRTRSRREGQLESRLWETDTRIELVSGTRDSRGECTGAYEGSHERSLTSEKTRFSRTLHFTRDVYSKKKRLDKDRKKKR